MLIPLLTTAIGAGAIWASRHVSKEVRRTGGWPTVPGRILERGVGNPMGGSGRNYLPHVRYSYSVGGREYTNDHVYLIRGTGGLSDAMQRLADALPDPVPVHYNPENPAESWLLLQPKSSFWIAAVFGWIIFLAGVLQLLILVIDPE